jgi:ABC-type glycerol-3-phosphate transport system permease component
MLALERFNPPVSQYTNRPNIGMQTAGYVAATIPQLVVFALGMKYFVEGMTSGSVKA